MTGNLVLIAVTAIAHLALGTLVLSRDPSQRTHRYFALVSLSLACWTLSNGLVSALATAPTGYIWARTAFASASGIAISFLLFVTVFPTPTPRPPQRLLQALSLAAAIVTVASFSPLIVKGTTSLDGTLRVIHGPFHLAFGVYWIGCISLGLFLLARKFAALKGFEKVQVRYFLFGALTAAMGATATNLLVPLIFQTSKLSPYGPLFGLAFTAMTAHSIIRHRFMDVHFVVRGGIVYLAATATAGLVFVAIIGLIPHLNSRALQEVPLSIQLGVVLGIALAFQPLKNHIQQWLDRYVYRQSYSYQRIMREATRKISSTLDLKSLLQYLTQVATTTTRPDLVMIYIREGGRDTFAVATHRAFPDAHAPQEHPRLHLADPLPLLLRSSRRPLLRDELGRTLHGVVPEGACAQLAGIGGECAIPMFSESDLLGFLVLGDKLSGDPYFSDDLELLGTVTNQAAIAVSNAQLYQQVVIVNDYVDNILSTMDSGVITVDAKGRVALCNSTAERLTGLTRTSLAASALEQLPSPLATQLRATLGDGRARVQLETSLSSTAGRVIPIVGSTAALRDKAGGILGALIVFTDVSKVKELEDEKRRAERLASFGALASGIAHEIKNPLVAIRTFAELLPERFADADFRDDFSKVVIREIDRIDDLVSRLRGLSGPPPQPTPSVDIREPLDETLVLLRGHFEQTRTSVIKRYEKAEPAYVAVDPSQLKQLFLNVFLNAVEAMGSNGQITVRLARRVVSESQFINVEISDTGPGIADDIRPHIFDPFFTTRSRGSGLGLAICRGITDAHRGTIRAESNQGGTGTTIVVEFPASTPRLELAGTQD